MKSMIGAALLTVTFASAVTAATKAVPAGGDLQAAFDAAHCGDTIVLDQGATYMQGLGYVLAAPQGPCAGTDADYVTVTTTGVGHLPVGQRIDPMVAGPFMARLLAPDSYPVISTRIGAHHYRFIGIDFSSNGNKFIPILITLSQSSITGAQPSWEQRLDMGHWIFDRCFIHPPEIQWNSLSNPSKTRMVERGIQTNNPSTTVINSYLAGFTGFDPNGALLTSEDLVMDVGPGPLLVDNNYLEAWYSSVFIGGSGAPPDPAHTASVVASDVTSVTLDNVADIQLGDLISFRNTTGWQVAKAVGLNDHTVIYEAQTALVETWPGSPSVGTEARWRGHQLVGVTLTRNSIVKRPEWADWGAAKNFMEFKTGKTVRVEGNILSASAPTNIAFTVRNQNGSSPWILIQDLVFTNNRVYGFKDPAFGMLLKDNENVTSNDSGNIQITNNLFTGDANDSKILGLTGGHDVVFRHNTILNSQAIGYGQIPAVGVGIPGFVQSDNIIRFGQYGLSCYVGSGGGTMDQCFPGRVTIGNVIIDNRTVPVQPGWFPGNFIAANDAAVGFMDPPSGNYRLAAGSPYKGKATDGTDPGVDQDALEAAIGGDLQPTPTPVDTDTPVPTATATARPSATPTATVTTTATVTPTIKPTNTPIPTNTPTTKPTATVVPTLTPTVIPTPNPTPIPVHPGKYWLHHGSKIVVQGQMRLCGPKTYCLPGGAMVEVVK